VVNTVEALRSFEKIKLLADSRRLAILRFLMASPATLTQLAARMGHSPAWIRHHLKALESAALVELVDVRVKGRATERYYRACSGALLLEQLVLPKARVPVLVFSGSHDLALQGIVDRLSRHQLFLTLQVGSLNGLIDLQRGLCQVAGAHLLDESGEYNTPYVRRLFPDDGVEVVTLAYRTQGLILAPGNPKALGCVQDLARPGIRLVNRNPGSGTRLWLERELRRSNLETTAIAGFQHEVKTHTEAASWVRAGKADVALGLQAAARLFGLDFVPLFEERYDLVLRNERERDAAPLLNMIQTADFRTMANSLTGYNTAHSGDQIHL
jgi:putative molybdopterin biosynthesis protein